MDLETSTTHSSRPSHTWRYPSPTITTLMQLKQLGLVDYAATYAAMQAFTEVRAARAVEHTQSTHKIGHEPLENKGDELWICEHFPVYTQGLAGRPEHVLNPGLIPLVLTDRGGQVTFHGPGQVVAYPLLDLRRAGYYVKAYVYRLEQAVLATLAHFGVTGHRVPGAPGIYVRLADPFAHAAWVAPAPGRDVFEGLGKIAALGIKVSRHRAYHGVALNVAMDLAPFGRINPCGYASLQTVDLASLGVAVTWHEAAGVLGEKLLAYLAP